MIKSIFNNNDTNLNPKIQERTQCNFILLSLILIVTLHSHSIAGGNGIWTYKNPWFSQVIQASFAHPSSWLWVGISGSNMHQGTAQGRRSTCCQSSPSRLAAQTPSVPSGLWSLGRRGHSYALLALPVLFPRVGLSSLSAAPVLFLGTQNIFCCVRLPYGWKRVLQGLSP